MNKPPSPPDLLAAQAKDDANPVASNGSFHLSQRAGNRALGLLAAHPHLMGSIAMHALLAGVLLSLPGLGESGRPAHQAATRLRQEQQWADTEARAQRYRVERMENIARRLSEAAGRPLGASAPLSQASPTELLARAQALGREIDAAERALQAAALARLTGQTLADARREVDARADADAETEARAAASRQADRPAPPAEALAKLEQRANAALQAQRAQLDAQRHGVRATGGGIPPGPAPITQPGQVAAPGPAPLAQRRPADGIPRSVGEQLKAEFRNGPPQGRVGVVGVQGGRSINRENVRGEAGGWIARPEDAAPKGRFADGEPVLVPGSSLDLTGRSGQGKNGGDVDLNPFLRPPSAQASWLRTGAGRSFGAGGAYANRVYLDSWYVIGPFDGSGPEALDAPHPPEDQVDLDAVYRGQDGRSLTWQYASRGFYPFIPPERAEQAVYYAYTELHLEEAQDLWLTIAADDDSKLWLDGRLIWTSPRGDKPWYRPPFYLPDEQVASLALAEGHRRVPLTQGVHRLLLKLHNQRDRVFFSVVLAP